MYLKKTYQNKKTVSFIPPSIPDNFNTKEIMNDNDFLIKVSDKNDNVIYDLKKYSIIDTVFIRRINYNYTYYDINKPANIIANVSDVLQYKSFDKPKSLGPKLPKPDLTITTTIIPNDQENLKTHFTPQNNLYRILTTLTVTIGYI